MLFKYVENNENGSNFRDDFFSAKLPLLSRCLEPTEDHRLGPTEDQAAGQATHSKDLAGCSEGPQPPPLE
jgi:hypothetical protein